MSPEPLTRHQTLCFLNILRDFRLSALWTPDETSDSLLFEHLTRLQTLCFLKPYETSDSLHSEHLTRFQTLMSSEHLTKLLTLMSSENLTRLQTLMLCENLLCGCFALGFGPLSPVSVKLWADLRKSFGWDYKPSRCPPPPSLPVCISMQKSEFGGSWKHYCIPPCAKNKQKTKTNKNMSVMSMLERGE